MRERKYYNSGGPLGIIGTYPGHQSGDFTFLVNHRKQWICTADLHDTYEAATQAPPARFLENKETTNEEV